jgi:hypothetical protein
MVGIPAHTDDADEPQESEIFPLRNSYFEDVPAKVPYAYTKLLVDEYGSKALSTTTYQGYVWRILLNLQAVECQQRELMTFSAVTNSTARRAYGRKSSKFRSSFRHLDC